MKNTMKNTEASHLSTLSAVPMPRGEMKPDQFNNMMSIGLEQAKAGDSLDFDEAFAELEQRI